MSTGKWPRRGALLAACLSATAAAGTAGAAAAAKLPAENIYGMGSSLQAVAQTNGVSPAGPGCSATGWQGWVDLWDCSPTMYETTLSNSVNADYTTESSAQGLAEFGNQGSNSSCPSVTGVLEPGCDPTAKGVLDSFIGTDDPPNAASLASAQTASGGPQEITIPVTEAPLAMILSLPTDITLAAGAQVKVPSRAIADAWSSTVHVAPACKAIDPADAGNTWCDLLVEANLTPIASGTPTTTQFLDGSDNGGPIILQARSSGSGTTYSFRGYLYELDQYGQTAIYPYTRVTDSPSDWPVSTTQTGNTSGGALVSSTTATPGSFGYANLADAALATPGYTKTAQAVSTGGTHQILYASVQNNTGDGSAAFYALPSSSTGTVNLYLGANIGVNVSTCAADATATVVGCWLVPSTPTGAWSSTDELTPGTIPSDADVRDHGRSTTGARSGAYPIAATTYDVAWSDYDTANLATLYNDPSCPPLTSCAADAGNATKSFLSFVTSTGQGRLAFAKVYYGSLPSTIKAKAVAAVKAITP